MDLILGQWSFFLDPSANVFQKHSISKDRIDQYTVYTVFEFYETACNDIEFNVTTG